MEGTKISNIHPADSHPDPKIYNSVEAGDQEVAEFLACQADQTKHR